jgi:hypothetical protein
VQRGVDIYQANKNDSNIRDAVVSLLNQVEQFKPQVAHLLGEEGKGGLPG